MQYMEFLGSVLKGIYPISPFLAPATILDNGMTLRKKVTSNGAGVIAIVEHPGFFLSELLDQERGK